MIEERPGEPGYLPSPELAPEAGSDAPATTRRTTARRWFADVAVLLGLAGVAITQPLLDLLGSNPTFFVAGHYESHQIVLFAVVVAVVPAATVFLLTTLASLPWRRLAPLFHGLGVGIFASLFGLALCTTLRVDGVVYVVPVVVGLGVVAAVVENRSGIVRQFLAYLALGNLAFVVLFLTSSPTAELLAAPAVAGQQGTVTVPPLAGPVVVVVLDEFPVTAIMRGDGTINDARYPNLARLAEQSTWFRNAASESRTTYVSAPTILSGVRSGHGRLPILDEHPRNYFTLFGDRYPVNRYELVTDMCPSDVCEPPPPSPTRQLLDDASVVYAHRVLPPDLRDGLPAIDTGWGNFDADVAGATSASGAPPTTERPGPMAEVEQKPEGELGGTNQLSAFRRQIGLIDGDPSVNFVHIVPPHHPYNLTPWGDGLLPATRMPDESKGGPTLPAPDDPAYDFLFRQIYPLQAMQIGAVDALVGDMLDHLEATGAWDDSLVVVMSDHGIDMTAPGFTRREDDTNTDELFRIPLFIKAPGQTEGAVDDQAASTVDVLPSIIDLLDIEADWNLEGHSLFDGSEPTIERHVQTDVDAALALAAAHEEQFPTGDDWVALAAVGEGEDLVGNPVRAFDTGTDSRLRWTMDDADVLDDLSVAHDQVPYIMEGTVDGSDERPPELVVAVNGTIAGTIGGYLPSDDGWRFSGYIAPFFEDGHNDVVAYEVERTGDTITLHPLVT